MNLNEKLKEFGLVERELMYNNDYNIEYFTFSRESAIKALCYLIDNAKDIIKIYHKMITEESKYLKTNKVIKALHDNKKVKIEYYTKTNLSNCEIIKKYFGNHVELKKLDLSNKNYHHKEMIIDNKYIIITSLNFLTNNLIDDINSKSFWLENFSVWVKRSEK